MSKIEVNTVEPQCGTTLTLGGSGDTVTLACGASQTGFGRTGTVDWDTSIKTGTVTAVSGSGYFVNTTSGGITVNLPAAAVGSIVAVSDYASTAASNNITITPNGSEKINGVNNDYTISTAGLAVTLVYADATKGWKSVTGSDADATGVVPTWVAASGGNTTITCGDYKVHVFTGPGTLCVSCAGNPAGSDIVEYAVVAGGGASGGYGSSGGCYQGGGGGGAGGFRSYTALTPASPINAPAGLTVSASPYPVTVGGGGAPAVCNTNTGASGSNSVFSTITSAGGGGGGGKNSPCNGSGANGGSGGGGRGSMCCQTVSTGGTGNTPSVSPVQGKDGGSGGKGPPNQVGGGAGGGAVTAGVDISPVTQNYGASGGDGTFIKDTFFGPTAPSYGQSPTPLAPNGRYFSGGGGGGSGNIAVPAPLHPVGGAGGGGNGGDADGPPATAGGTNTGGGGGGPSSTASEGGGSGVVFIRYKYQN